MTARNILRGQGLGVGACVALLVMDAPVAGQDRVEPDSGPERGELRGESKDREAREASILYERAQAYRLGRGQPVDFDRALQLYREAAAAGHLKARDNYGLLLFRQGEREAAIPLITEAAKRGDPRAQYVLGIAHFNGDWVPKDWVQAYALVTLASTGGMPQARAALAQMDKHIPIRQRRLAQALVRQFETGEALIPAPTAPLPERNPAIAATSASSQAAEASVDSGIQGEWTIQLGTFAVPGNAERLWSTLSSNPILAGADAEFSSSGPFTVLRASGFADREAARETCRALAGQGRECLVKR